ncbi:Ger(x)C family spore germination protein [Neobacillus sp. SAB-20_R2A]|uniref:Ger(x)C family spore germination protein n=1 Tax=Neobacillus sp. SAB-20_R2A TaxID=3120519 RepID=UPI003C6E62AA
MNGPNLKFIITFLAALLTLTACNYPNNKTIDDIQIPSVLGLDKGKDHYIGTILYTDYTKEEEKGEVTTLVGNGRNTRTILEEMDEQSSKPVEIGKLSLLLFGKELAEDGIAYFVKTICRDPLVGSNMYVAVSEGQSGELLKNSKSNSSDHIVKLIEHRYEKGELPLPNMHSFLFDYYGEGRDNAIPILKVNSVGKITTGGLAIFKNDKLITTIDKKETFLYKILKGRKISGESIFDVKKEERKGSIVFTVLYGEIRKRFDRNSSIPKIHFHMELQGMVKDYPTWLDLRADQNKYMLKKQLEEQVEKECKKLLYKLTANKVDPLGIGDLVRAKTRDWDEKEFYEKIYPNVQYDIDLNIELTRAGIGE